MKYATARGLFFQDEVHQVIAIETTSDGWSVTDARSFQFLISHEPPRPYGYWDQICEDARSWLCVGLWLVILGLFTGSLVLDQQLLAIPAAGLAGFWGMGCRIVVRDMRSSPVSVGIIDEVKPHPLVNKWRTANAVLPDGTEAGVTLEGALVDVLWEPGKRLEVAFLNDPKAEYSRVIGVRELTMGQSQQTD